MPESRGCTCDLVFGGRNMILNQVPVAREGGIQLIVLLINNMMKGDDSIS